MLTLAALVLVSCAGAPPAQIPGLADVVVDRDDMVIERSSRVLFLSPWFHDDNGNGVLHVIGDDIVVDFDGTDLNGASKETPLDAVFGVGVRVTGKRVTLRNGHFRGFKAAIHASGADGLVVEDCTFEGNFAQHLRSTIEAEDGADWLWPHENDGNEWLANYGAALYVEDARDVTIRRNRVRTGQNGFVLDRVESPKVYDNDASFLSGWGLALWRTSDGTITRNAFDFCIRGYSHGVYNRGQDSAGILVFEQCSRNFIAENSATHGGDGFFGFAGKEALGDDPPPHAQWTYARKGNCDNALVANDVSYAAAHGIEMTFSFGNIIRRNRLVENAICGIWGGYSKETWIEDNDFERNGGAGYGLERGGVNIEHGSNNRIRGNRFVENACGVHLWWDEDEHLVQSAWAKANGADCTTNEIIGNNFTGDAIAIALRAAKDTYVMRNRHERVGKELEADAASEVHTFAEDDVEPVVLERELLGTSHPVGARPALRGRDKIVMGEWGPYDWESPLLQRVSDGASDQHTWRLLGPKTLARARVASGEVKVRVDGELITVTPKVAGAGTPYVIAVEAGDAELQAIGHILALDWDVCVFRTTKDPREDLVAFHADAEKGLRFHLADLRLDYGAGGVSNLANVPQAARDAKLPGDRFGTIASTPLALAPGQYRIRTISDDGIRVWLGDELLIDDWTWHGPKPNDADLDLEQTSSAPLRVEHFELDGAAALTVQIDYLGPPR